jgi:hypothetical protein
MCARRLDLAGGGIKNLGCWNGHGGDGAAGIPAESSFDWGGVIGGLLIDSALGLGQNLAGIIAGPPGVALSVFGREANTCGTSYTRQRLERPPVLTIRRGALFQVRTSADLAF